MEIRGHPFPFTIQGDPCTSARARLGVQLVSPIDQASFDQLRCVVSWFGRMASFGGVGGSLVPPERTTATLANEDEPSLEGSHPIWTFDAFLVDPRSITILANLIYGSGLQVHSVWLHTGGESSNEVFMPDDFPEADSYIPFAVDRSLTDRNVQITATFVEDLLDNQRDTVCEMLKVWSLVAALGGFRNVGPLRGKLDLLPEEDPEIILDEVSFAVRDEGLNEAAYDSLVNMFVRLHRSGKRVKALSIQ